MLRAIAEAVVQLYKILLGWFIVILLLPFLIPLYIYKQCIVLVGKFQGLACTESCIAFALHTKVAFGDKVENDYERKPLSNLTAYADLGEGNIDLNELIQKVQTSVVDKERDNAFRLKSYLVRFGGYVFWKQNPDFKTSDHVHKVKLPPGEDILDFINIWNTEPYESKSSLWRVLVIDAESTEHLAIKVYHALGDALSVIEFVNCIFDTPYHSHVEQFFNRPSKGRSFLDMMIAFIKAPAIFMEISAKLKKVVDPFQLTQGIEVEEFASELSFNIQDIKSITKKQGVSFGAVLITVYARAIGKYLASIRNTELESLTVIMPQPWPGRPKNFIGNHYNIMHAVVPLSNPSSLETLCQVQADIADYYSSRKYLVYKYFITELGGLFPSCFLSPDAGSDWGRCSVSPVLMADEYFYNGRPVRSMHVRTGICTTVFGLFSPAMSRKGTLNWMVVGAKDLFKTKENLCLLTHKYMTEEFENLLQASNNSEFILVPPS